MVVWNGGCLDGLIEDLCGNLPEKHPLGVKNIEFLEKQCRIESSYSLALFCEFHVEPCCLFIHSFLSELVGFLHVERVLSHRDDML